MFYNLGHCANDENEPKLYRYKEECEDACVTSGSRNNIGELIDSRDENTPQTQETYATAAPLPPSHYDILKTECQRQREAGSTNSLIKGGFVPQCTENGDFKPLQCEPNGLVCFCVNSEGIEIKNSRCLPGQEKPDCASNLKIFLIFKKFFRNRICFFNAH